MMMMKQTADVTKLSHGKAFNQLKKWN